MVESFLFMAIMQYNPALYIVIIFYIVYIVFL